MTTAQLKNQIELLAKEENISFVEACQAMQGAASKLGDEKMIMVIHDLKMESLGITL